MSETSFADATARIDAVIADPAVSATFLFALADALHEWSRAEAAADHALRSIDLAMLGIRAIDAAQARLGAAT